jgi:2-iminobutanoate/2-iminopropanoate deaminase
MKRIIHTSEAPSPIGPYSQAVLAGDTLYVSGQIALDAETGELITDTLEKETLKVMENLEAVLAAAEMNFSNVVKCSIFLSDMNAFSVVNGIYANFFNELPPARETVEVACLPKNVNVEISCIAVRA